MAGLMCAGSMASNRGNPLWAQCYQGILIDGMGCRVRCGVVSHGLEARCFLDAFDAGFGAFYFAASGQALVT